MAEKRQCPHCGAPVYATDDVCMSCGGSLRQLEPAAAKPRPAVVARGPREPRPPTARRAAAHGGRQNVQVAGVDLVSYVRLISVLAAIICVPFYLVGIPLVLSSDYPVATWIALAAVLVGGYVATGVAALLAAGIFNLVCGWVGGINLELKTSRDIRVGPHEIKEIRPASAARWGAILGFYGMFFTMVVFIILLHVIVTIARLAVGGPAGLSIAGLLLILIPVSLAGGLLGGLLAALSAVVYNFLAVRVGGVKLQMG